ncbi:MAG TPA: hypothetical protein VEY92_08470 [Pseudoxanthomonas sp.]|nr:hypothetical protein [Pseudoxanthomonas sp.]
MTPAQIKLALLTGLVLLLLGIGWSCAKRDSSGNAARATVKAQARAAKQVERSVAISVDTQRRVERESEQTGQRTQRAVESIDVVIQANPVADGPADPAVLRESREAYQRAICAHSRVQRAVDCADSASAP